MFFVGLHETDAEIFEIHTVSNVCMSITNHLKNFSALNQNIPQRGRERKIPKREAEETALSEYQFNESYKFVFLVSLSFSRSFTSSLLNIMMMKSHLRGDNVHSEPASQPPPLSEEIKSFYFSSLSLHKISIYRCFLLE